MLTILNFLVMTMMMAIVVMALIIAMTTMDYDDDDVGLVVMIWSELFSWLLHDFAPVFVVRVDVYQACPHLRTIA